MKRSFAGFRIATVLLFLVGFLSPIALTGASAQDLTCDDFNSQRAAQAVLDADPKMADALDPDGDGTACNHDENTTDNGSSDNLGGASDASAAYLNDVEDLAADWSDLLDQLLDIDPIRADVTDAEVTEINSILTEFASAPDDAADFDVPAGMEDVQATLEDLADAYAAYSDAVVAWSQTDSGSRRETRAAEAVDAALAEIDALDAQLADAIDAADVSGGNTNNGGSADADAYLADAQDLVDEWADGLADWNDLDVLGSYTGFTQDDWDAANAIIALWSTALDDAESLIAPTGYEDVQAALEDLADGYDQIQSLAIDWSNTQAGTTEEATLEAQIEDGIDAIADLEDAFDQAVADAGGNGNANNQNTNGVDADIADYLDAVSAHNQELTESAVRFATILSADSITDADQEEIANIIALWTDAPDEAASIDVPAGMEDIQADYEDVANAYATAADNLSTWLDAPEGRRADRAWDNFTGALADATALSAELDATIQAAG